MYSRIDLVQRGTFKGIADADVTGIDSVVRFDYMGSAEFEFGALPAALKELLPNLDAYKIHSTEYKSQDGQALFLFCPDEMLEFVHAGLVLMTKDKRDGGARLKERSKMFDALNPDKSWPVSINFWWDLNNNWFAALDEENIKRLKLGLECLRERWIAEKKISA